MKDENMSPLLYYTKKQTEKTSEYFKGENLIIDFAMRYGNPSIKSKIAKLKSEGCENESLLWSFVKPAVYVTVAER